MSTKPKPSRPYRMERRRQLWEATGERLLAAGWDDFSTRPYEDVRLSDIAQAAGVTVQTLHTRFGTKEEFFAAVFRWWVAHERIRRDAARPGDIEDAVAVVFDHYERYGRAVLRMIDQEDRIPAVREHTDFGRAYHREWVGTVFEPMLGAVRAKARADLHEQLIVVTDVFVWRLLRLDIGHSRPDAQRIVVGMISALTAAGPGETP